ncbi:prion-inhibition and propagation-domain-containing protein [Trichophaea hybrida]|nr:prion-inhibition and propagation-domain-containing protein [Trichophaea hybrida]
MPVDPIGLTLGLASLASLFTTCLDVLGRISEAKSYGLDHELFVTKVKTERLRFFRWGQIVQQHGLLQDPKMRETVCELLAWAVYHFEDSEGLMKPRRGPRTRDLLFGRSRALGFAGPQVLISNNPRARARKLQREASVFDKMRWTFSGKGKSEKVLQELRWFVDTFHDLVPIDLTLQLHPLSIAPDAELNRAATLPDIQPRVGDVSGQEISQLPPPAETEVGTALHTTIRNRNHRKLVLSRIHQTRKSVPRISTGEARIRANER